MQHHLIFFESEERRIGWEGEMSILLLCIARGRGGDIHLHLYSLSVVPWRAATLTVVEHECKGPNHSKYATIQKKVETLCCSFVTGSHETTFATETTNSEPRKAGCKQPTHAA